MKLCNSLPVHPSAKVMLGLALTSLILMLPGRLLAAGEEQFSLPPGRGGRAQSGG